MEAGVDEFPRLLPDGGHHLRMAVTDVVHPDTACEIDILAAIDINHDGTAGLGDEGVGDIG